MAETDPMNISERRKYLHKMRIIYWQTERKSERSHLLDDMETVTGLHRKSLLRLINGELARKLRRKQRGKIYGPEVDAVITKIAQSLDYPRAERLKPNLVWMADHLEAHDELSLSAKTREQLGSISVSSLRRRLPKSNPSRFVALIGMSAIPAILKWTWYTIVVLAPVVNMLILCNY